MSAVSRWFYSRAVRHLPRESSLVASICLSLPQVRPLCRAVSASREFYPAAALLLRNSALSKLCDARGAARAILRTNSRGPPESPLIGGDYILALGLINYSSELSRGADRATGEDRDAIRSRKTCEARRKQSESDREEPSSEIQFGLTGHRARINMYTRPRLSKSLYFPDVGGGGFMIPRRRAFHLRASIYRRAIIYNETRREISAADYRVVIDESSRAR